jgi:hypothetical protein
MKRISVFSLVPKPRLGNAPALEAPASSCFTRSRGFSLQVRSQAGAWEREKAGAWERENERKEA